MAAQVVEVITYDVVCLECNIDDSYDYEMTADRLAASHNREYHEDK